MNTHRNFDPSKYALIDLHLHIDGALSPEAIIKMAEMSHTLLPTNNISDLKKLLTVSDDCRDLNEYLDRFELPVRVMQTKETISYAVYDLIKRLDAQGLIYTELRYAPQLHTQNGLTQEDVVQASIDGLNRGLFESSIKAQLILCAMRMEDNQEANLETAKLVGKYLNHGVAALDLAGAEALYLTENFKTLFDYARSLNIPYTIHAGEASGYESIDKALEFGTLRIGHGIRSLENDETVRRIIRKDVTLELCPTSNLQTKALSGVLTMKDYPLKKLATSGISVTINTDNPTVSGITLKKEFETLFKAKILSENDAKIFVYHSINAAFLTEPQKKALRAIADKRMR